jgi:hypothetical protein
MGIGRDVATPKMNSYSVNEPHHAASHQMPGRVLPEGVSGNNYSFRGGSPTMLRT